MNPSRAISFAVLSLGLTSCSVPKDSALSTASLSSAAPMPVSYAGFTGATAAQTINGSKVQVSWTPSTDPSVVAYNIYDATFTFAPKLIKTVSLRPLRSPSRA